MEREKKKQDFLTKMKQKRLYFAAFLFSVIIVPARGYANDVFTSINKLQGFVLDLIMYAGVIFIGFGVVSLIMSITGHDEAARQRGVLAIIGGLIAVGIRALLDLLGVAHQ